MIAAAALAILAAPAGAATIVESFSTGSPWANIAKFDSSLGTLTSVEVLLSFDSSKTFRVSANCRRSTTPCSVSQNAELAAEFRVWSMPGSTYVSPLKLEDRASREIGCTAAVGDTCSDSETLRISDRISETYSGRHVAEFIGPGYLRVSGSASSADSFTLSGAFTYSYDPVALPPAPVPLPAGLPLMLGGLAGLVLLRRRRG